MYYSNFLTNCRDDGLRNKLWELFNQAEPEAKWFDLLHGNWVEIESVEVATGFDWNILPNNNAKILVNPKVNEYELGAIFHEVYHSAFHNSPLWNNPKNSQWGEGFCNAFRYYMEKKLLDKDWWIDKFNADSSKTDVGIISTGDKKWDIRHGITGYRIIKASKGDFKEFKKLWQSLNQDKTICLDDYFDFPLNEYLKQYNI